MTNRNIEASDADLAEQAVPVMAGDGSEEEQPGIEIAPDDHANIADVIEQHQAVPSDDDDYDR